MSGKITPVLKIINAGPIKLIIPDQVHIKGNFSAFIIKLLCH